MKKQVIACAAIALTTALLAGTAQASAQTHTIKTNDTFWNLAQHYQIPLGAILNANAALDPLNLQLGTKIVIPSSNNLEMKAVAPEAVQDKSKPAAKAEAQTVMAPDGSSHAYTKQLQVKATAYTAAASENGKWGAVDYFGNKLKVGTIAVDPAMIPLGSKVYITGYQYPGLPEGGMVATATDMGGSIKGNRIDIFVPGTTQKAKSFGFQDVKVYMLK